MLNKKLSIYDDKKLKGLNVIKWIWKHLIFSFKCSTQR